MMCSYAFVQQRMILQCFDGLYLAFSSTVMFLLLFAFAAFIKNLVRECSLRLVTVMPLAEVSGTIAPGHIDHWDRCLANAMLMLIFMIGHCRVD
jgi:hypothetical protein